MYISHIRRQTIFHTSLELQQCIETTHFNLWASTLMQHGNLIVILHDQVCRKQYSTSFHLHEPLLTKHVDVGPHCYRCKTHSDQRNIDKLHLAVHDKNTHTYDCKSWHPLWITKNATCETIHAHRKDTKCPNVESIRYQIVQACERSWDGTQEYRSTIQ